MHYGKSEADVKPENGILQYVHAIIRLTRYKEYYGSVIFLTGLGLLVSRSHNISVAVITTCANLSAVAFCFVINNMEDSSDDALDPAKQQLNPISAGHLSRNKAALASIAFCVAAVTFYVMVGLIPLFVGASTLIVGFLYSWKKIRLKAVPFLDLILHGLFLGTPQFLAIVTTTHDYQLRLTMIVAFLVCILSMIADINNEIRDYTIDRIVGLKNTLSIIDLRSLQPLLPGISLVIILLLIAITFDRLTIPGKLMILAVVAIALISFALSPQRSRKEKFFYDRSQQCGALLGLLFTIMRG